MCDRVVSMLKVARSDPGMSPKKGSRTEIKDRGDVRLEIER